MHGNNSVKQPQEHAGDTKSLRKRVEKLIDCGDIEGAMSFIENFSSEIRQEITQPDPFLGSNGLLYTAVEKNSAVLIRFLVEKCGINMEMPFYNVCACEKNEYTPLCYAVKINRFEAVEELIRLGVNVNAPSSSTTALILSVPNTRICRLLLDSGADVNATSYYGDTALHFAALHGRSEIVKMLLKNGADMFQKTGKGADALHVACMVCATSVVRVMVDHMSQNDVRRQMQAFQLLGARLLDDDDDIDDAITDALTEWQSAIELREKNGHILEGKDDIVSTPNPAYDNAVEIDSISKLNEVRQDVDMIYMQGLLLKEKILGPAHILTISSLTSRGNFYLENQDYGRGLRLLRRGFKFSCDCWLDTKDSSHINKLQNVCTSFPFPSDPNTIGNRLNFKDVFEFLETVTTEAVQNTKANAVAKSQCVENLYFVNMVLFLIKLFSRVKKTDDQIFQFKKSVHGFIRLNLRSANQRTLLMNAVCTYDDEDDWSAFLEADTIALLLDCGAKAEERDEDGNSALHLLAGPAFWTVKAGRFGPSKEEVKQVAEMLLASGAHFDSSNNVRFSAVFFLNHIGLGLSTPLTLQCLAAQVIRRHRISYAGILTKRLIDFVKMH